MSGFPKGWRRLGFFSLVACFVGTLMVSSPGSPSVDRQALQLPRSPSLCADPHNAPDGGDCQALQGHMRRPEWACFSDMRAMLPDFVKLYEQRPVNNNDGGMRLDHSFALYYILLNMRPTPETIIESGAFKGHSTWIMRQALPHTRIISLDPLFEPQQRLEGVEYILLSDWADLAQIDWRTKGVNPENSLVFIDDHQSGYRRVLLEMKPMGFSRFILDDNFEYLKGDNMSIKWVCELQRETEWPGTVLDNFSKESSEMTWDYHLKQAAYLPKIFQTYYEFPPIVSTELSGQTQYDPSHASAPIVQDREFFEKSGLVSMDAIEFANYFHFAYVEIWSDVTSTPPKFKDSS